VQLALNLHASPHGLDRTGKFSEQRIAGSVHHATAVLHNMGRNDFSVCGQRIDRAVLILTHQSGVPDYIGTDDGR
jgi:hypothetical protein